MAGALTLALSTITSAQNPPQAADQNTPDRQNIFVRDTGPLQEKLALVARLEQQQDWIKAAEILDEIEKNYPDRVVLTTADNQEPIRHYTSLNAIITRRISLWPAEGLAAYRAGYEIRAQALLQQAHAGDDSVWQQVYTRYFNTSAGLDAGVRLSNAAFLQGHFLAAGEICQQLLDWHQLAKEQQPALLFRAALSYQLGGRTQQSQNYLRELKQHFADARLVIGGQEQLAAAALEQAMQQHLVVGSEPSPDHWPILGGDASRGRISTTHQYLSAQLLFHVALALRAIPNLPPNRRVEFTQQQDYASKAGSFLGIIPVTDRGELYFQDGRNIYAAMLKNNTVAPNWAGNGSGKSTILYTDQQATALPAAQQLTVTLTDHEVLAIMGLPDGQGIFPPSATPSIAPHLVCLDRDSGALKWSFTPDDVPRDGSAVKQFVFSGSPLVMGKTVYFIARDGRRTQFEDAYVIAVNLADGSYQWSTYIAGAMDGSIDAWDDPQGNAIAPQGTSHLAGWENRVLVMTNLGAIAAVDNQDGHIVWLSTYPRNHAASGASLQRSTSPSVNQLQRPWTYNPAIISQDKLFALPSDSDDLLIYAADSGQLIKSIKRRDLGMADTLIGVDEQKLITAAADRVSCIDWEKYDRRTFGGDDDYTVVQWISSFGNAQAADPGRNENEHIRGRPFLTHDSIFVPTGIGLYRIDLSSGMKVQQYPICGQRWGKNEAPGNIIVTADSVIVASDEGVSIYGDQSK